MNGLAAGQSTLMEVLADPEQLKQRLASLQDAERRAAVQINITREEVERITAECDVKCQRMVSSAEASGLTTIHEANVLKSDASALMDEARTTLAAAVTELDRAQAVGAEQTEREVELQARAKTLETRAQELEQKAQRLNGAARKLAEAGHAVSQVVG